MHALSAVLLLGFLPLTVLAGNGFADSHFSLHDRHSAMARRVQKSTKTYQLVDKYQGTNFFDTWDFFSGDDPSHGNVHYLNLTMAMSKGLAFVSAQNTTVLAVDDTSTIPVGGMRNSVRISSKKTYNGGLFIADFFGMPHGCGLWPSWWSAGPRWPEGGEIDIIEGVNLQTNNQQTLHSSGKAGACTLNRDAGTSTSRAFTANVMGLQCASADGDNAGCAFSDPDPKSFGAGFNSGGGGVFVHLWDSTGVKMWRFPRSAIPADIIAGNPNPSSWPIPQSSWSSDTCDMASHFYDHTLTLDTTICGDWAGGAYANSGCAGTCDQAVADPKNFAYAKWKIHYIAVYQ